MLTVDFPPEWQGRNSQLILRPHDFYLDGAVRVLVDPTHRDYLSDSPLFISLESHGHEDIPKFALKFAFRGDFLSSLEFENAVYNLLKPLQGTVIPRSLGLFMCEKQDDSIGCLALEYWGSTLSQPFYTLPLHLKLKILRQLSLIHRAGCLHGDVAERNVLIQGEDIRIIDFDDAEEHECGCNIDMVVPGRAPPPRETFGCDELWQTCMLMQIWTLTS